MLIDMTDFPYASEDVVKDKDGKPFCTIHIIQRGDVKDSFGGYIIQEATTDKVGDKIPTPGGQTRKVMGCKEGAQNLGFGQIPEGPEFEGWVMVEGPLAVPESQMVTFTRSAKGSQMENQQPYDFLKILEKEVGIKMPEVVSIDGETVETETAAPDIVSESGITEEQYQQADDKYGIDRTGLDFILREIKMGSKDSEIAKEFENLHHGKVGAIRRNILKMG